MDGTWLSGAAVWNADGKSPSTLDLHLLQMTDRQEINIVLAL